MRSPHRLALTRRRALKLLTATVAAGASGIVRSEAQSSFDPANWMRDHAQHFAGKKLSDMTLPGTHDSGAFDFTSEVLDQYQDDTRRKIYEVVKIVRDIGIAGLGPFQITDAMITKTTRDWSKAQGSNIAEQLAAGIRWFDLRTMRYKEDFYLYHGFIAHTMRETLDAVKAFTDAHPSEIVVLYISHFSWTSEATHTALAELIKTVLGTSRLCGSIEDLQTKTVAELVSAGTRVVAFYDSALPSRTTYPWLLRQESYYYTPNIESTNLDDLTSKANAAIAAYSGQLPINLAWTLTPGDAEIWESIGNQFNPVSGTHDLRWFTNSTRDALTSYLALQRNTRIGIVSVDFAESSSVVADCVARSIRPLPPIPTSRVKFIAAGSAILKANPDGTWSRTGEIPSYMARDFSASAIWASAPDKVYLFGYNGFFARYRGELADPKFDWFVNGGSTRRANAITGFGQEVWAAGVYSGFTADNGVTRAMVMRYTEGARDWDVMTIGQADITFSLNAIGGTSSANMFAGGQIMDRDTNVIYAVICQPVNGTWKETWRGLPGQRITGLWACGVGDVYATAAGATDGAVIHWNGSTWTEVVTQGAYQAIWASGPSDVVAVGLLSPTKGPMNGLISRFNGSEWSHYTTTQQQTTLFGVYGSARQDVTVVGRQNLVFSGPPNIILTWDGTSWRETVPQTDDALNGVWQN